MYINFHVNYPLFLSYLMKLQLSQQIFEISSNIKFHENPSSGSRVVPCRRTDAQDRHDEVDSPFFHVVNAPLHQEAEGQRLGRSEKSSSIAGLTLY